MAVLIYPCVFTVGITCLLFHGVSCQVFNNCTGGSNTGHFNTTVYNDNVEVTEFPCMTNNGKNVCPLWPGNLPNGLSNGSSVAKPRDFGATMFTDTYDFGEKFGNRTCAGAVFTWRVPVDQTSRLNTKGYFLKMDRVGSAISVCRTFDVQGFNLDSSKINFRFETFPFQISSGPPVTFIASLYSLPPPSADEMEEGLEAYERVVLTIPICTDLKPLPAAWTTWIVVKNPDAGTVKVSFGFAEDSLNFGFAKYHVRLFRNGDTTSAFNETIVDHISGSQQFGMYVFKNVPAGEYLVQVFPDEPHFNDESKCLCNEGPHEPPIPGNKCTACTRTESSITVKDIPLTATPTPTTLPTTTTTTAKPTTPQSPSGPGGVPSTDTTTSRPTSDTTKYTSNPVAGASTGHTGGPGPDSAVVAGAVIGSLALVGVVAVAAFLCWKQFPHWRHVDFNENNIKKKPEKVWALDTAFPPVTGPDQKAAPQMKRKRVFLLAAEDHPYHMKAVEMYAEFLRVHCYCDVTFTPQCRAELRGQIIYCWMSGEIEQADYVVIVTSMAAYRLYHAFQKGLSFRDAHFGPEGDLFMPGIQHICGMITCNADVQKVLMVHFEHTMSDLRLPIGALPSSLYLLPRHLCDFLKHIHGVDHNSSALSKVLPRQCNISQLPEGNAWLSAVQEAKAFERDYPDWFDEKFGNPSEVTRLPRTAPEYTTQESGFYSNDGGSIRSHHSADLQRKLSSVSMQAERFMSGFDPADPWAPVFTITKDDFIEPSMCFSAYTVPPGSTFAGGNLPEEIDDKNSTTSERLRRFNQRYELDLMEETGRGGVGHYPIVQAAIDTSYNISGCMHQGDQKEITHTCECPSRGQHVENEHVYTALPQMEAGVNLPLDNADRVEEDLVSISSAQSV